MANRVPNSGLAGSPASLRAMRAGSSATQLMRAVSWHDMAGVSSRIGNECISTRRADSGRHSAGFVSELGSTQGGWLTESRLARGFGSRAGCWPDVVGERSCPLAGGALAELKVAGPHAVQRRVIADARSGGLPDVTRRSGGWYCE